MEMPAATPVASRLRSFVVFEGGGAKGLVHVGALRALETEGRFDFQGYAGTSAGAIVAALAAAGICASDIVDPETGQTILDRVEERFRKPTSIFGRGRWPVIRAFRAVWFFLKSRRKRFIAGLCFVLISAAFFVGVYYTLLPNIYMLFSIYGFVLSVGFALGIYMIGHFFSAGLGRLGDFRALLQAVLQNKLFPNDPDHTVVFSDFGAGFGPTLKIVATNITNCSLTLFCPENTPNISVADAVCASICLPVLFGRWSVRGADYYDGGLVSNLPAWCFDEERLIDPKAVTIGIEIDASPGAEDLAKETWWVKAIRTIIFGASVLNKRAVNAFISIRLSTEVGLLGFDLGRPKTLQVVLDAENATRVQLQRHFEEPRVLARFCQLAQVVVQKELENNPEALKTRVISKKIRASLAVAPNGHKKSVRLEHCTNFETDEDIGLVLPMEGSFAEEWRSSPTPKLFKKEDLLHYLRDPKHDERRRVIRSDLQWVFCVPILANDGDLRFVTAIDGGDELAHEWRGLNELFTNLGQKISDIFAEAVELV